MMTIKNSLSLAITAFVLVMIFAFAVSGAYADSRDSRDRGATGRTIETTPPPSNSTPTPAPTLPTPPTGGITNVTEGSVSSGGNTGGNVTTGEEHVDVHVVNVGPTNPPPPPPPAEVAPTPAPTTPPCDPRDRLGCAAQDTGRIR